MFSYDRLTGRGGNNALRDGIAACHGRVAIALFSEHELLSSLPMPPSGSQRTRAKAPSQSQARAKSQRRQPRGSQARRQTQAHDESEDEGHNDDNDAENDAGMDVDEDSSQGADGVRSRFCDIPALGTDARNPVPGSCKEGGRSRPASHLQ